MKRKIIHIIMFVWMGAMAAFLPSCRSSKKAHSEFYGSDSEMLRGDRHKNDKNVKSGKLDHNTRKRIIAEAHGWLGTPYAYGRADKGKACDCSGMVMVVYENIIGVKLPRNSAQQQDFCESIRQKDVDTGDLCFFATGKDPDKTSHVGIMIDDTNFIHASSSKGVVVSDITQPYYVRTFKGYGRVPTD